MKVEKARDLKALRGYCDRLLGSCRGILRNRFRMKREDDLGFMIMAFAPVQLDHLRGVTTLVDERLFAQATILARCMLEGFGYLYWAKDNPTRATNWRAYSLVHDLKHLRELQARGEQVDQGKEADLLKDLRSHGRVFLKKRAIAESRKLGLDAILSDPDSYHKEWHVDLGGSPLRIGEILEQGLNDKLLAGLYGDLSAHAHWRADGLGRHISNSPSGVEIDTGAALGDGASAMAMAFQACIQTFALLVVHFGRPEAAVLSSLKDDYVRAISKLRSAGER